MSRARCARWNTAWTFSSWMVSFSPRTRAASISVIRDSVHCSMNWKGAEPSSSCTQRRPRPRARSLGLPDSLIDFTADTTRAVAQLHYGNIFARTPNVKYIFSHAGGTIPYLAARFSIIDEMDVIPGAQQRGTAADTLRRLYWDTALSWRPPVLRMLRSVVGMGQVLFGTDYPYLRRDLAVACRHEVEASLELDSEESRAVLADTALTLFPRLAGGRA